jgi:tripeptide aminopeptidase
MEQVVEEINARHGAGTVTAVIRDNYRNMREKVEPHMQLITKAEEAFRKNGVEPLTQPIRGGTDGAALSQMGLPCPNLSTGGYQMHGIYEFIPVRALDIMPKMLQDLVCSFVEEETV